MYGVIGEDRSDVDAIKVLVKRITEKPNLKVMTKGYGGCGELLRKGAKQLRAFEKLGMTRFVVCYDSDRDDPKDRLKQAHKHIVRPSHVQHCCVVVPVQELEAWILADLAAVSNVISSWTPASIDNPETIQDPKEFLEKQSRNSSRKPRYSHAVHNARMAEYVDLDIVYRKCPSFQSFYQYAKADRS